MRNDGEGSKVARGRKKRRKLKPNTPVKPATEAQTMCLRKRLMGGSGSLATIGPAAGGFATGRAAAFVTPVLTEEVGVEVVFEAPDPAIKSYKWLGFAAIYNLSVRAWARFILYYVAHENARRAARNLLHETGLPPLRRGAQRDCARRL